MFRKLSGYASTTPGQGARRVWRASRGHLWVCVSEWNSPNVSMHDPKAKSRKTWRLPGDRPHCYAVFVDERNKVWLSDFGGNSALRLDPGTERFESWRFPRKMASVR